MSKVVAWTEPDGMLAVAHPNAQELAALVADGMSEEEALSLLVRVPSEALDVLVCELTDLPQKRTFRNAWRQKGGKVEVDMPLARELKMVEIRRERDARLKEADKDFMKALSTKKDTASLEAKMQALRDVPQVVNLEAIETPDALEAFQPAWPE